MNPVIFSNQVALPTLSSCVGPFLKVSLAQLTDYLLKAQGFTTE